MINFIIEDLMEEELNKKEIYCEKCNCIVSKTKTTEFFDSKQMKNKTYCNKCFAAVCDYFIDNDVEEKRLEI